MNILVTDQAPKYDIRICSCGTIHFIPDEKISKALDDGQNLLWICGSCGQGTLIGSDIEPNIYDDSPDAPKWVHNMYSMDLNPNCVRESISFNADSFRTTDDVKGISEIYYSTGIKVPMMTGYNAKLYNSANQYFMDIWFPDWYKIVGKPEVTVEEILQFINEHRTNSTTVNMHRFVRQTNKKYLQILAQSHMPEFDWTGTEYEEIHKAAMDKLHGKKGD